MEQPDPQQSGTTQFKEPLDLESHQDELLRCPACHQIIKGEDINIHRLVAKCGHCGKVFSFENLATGNILGYSRPETLMPEGLEVLKLPNELDITANWFKTIPRSSLTFTLVFCLLWNLILLPFVIAALVTGTYGVLLFTSVHILVGLAFLYRLLSIFVNTTHVNVTRRRLQIVTTPLPSPLHRTREIPVENIDQLYVTRYVDTRTNGNPNYAYALYVILKNGEKLRLAKGMNADTQKYLENEIESFLGITNRPIEGSV